MKVRFLIFLLCLLAFFKQATSQEFRDFYGICWRGKPHDNLLYARQMKYDYVFYQKSMENDSLSNGLYFYLETPEYFTYDAWLSVKKNYTQSQIQFYEQNCIIKSPKNDFPYNLATGWFFSDTTFRPMLDFQQQKVISYVIDSIINFAKQIESHNPKFHFGGLAWDVPNIDGDFWDTLPKKRQVSLTIWNGKDASVCNKGAVHNFQSYSEGHAQFYKQLFSQIRKFRSQAKFISEPYRIYDDWISTISTLPYAKDISPDLICQESPGLDFISDKRIFNSNLVNKEHVASTTPNQFGEVENRLLAATAAMNGAWFTWYGRFGGSGDMPNYQNIMEVPDRLKLIRLLSIYENKNLTPVDKRHWDGTTYSSLSAFADPKAILIMQPSSNKYFVVFMVGDAEIPIPANKIVSSIYRTDNYLIESGDGRSDIVISNGKIKPSKTNQINKSYIIQFK